MKWTLERFYTDPVNYITIQNLGNTAGDYGL
jgi:hypothetical protein